MPQDIEVLRAYARDRYRRLHNVPPERYQNGRSHPDNLEYHRKKKRDYYHRHKERLSAERKILYENKKNKNKNDPEHQTVQQIRDCPEIETNQP